MNIETIGQAIQIIGLLAIVGAFIHKFLPAVFLGLAFLVAGSVLIDIAGTVHQKDVQEQVISDVPALRRAMLDCLDQRKNFIVGPSNAKGFETKCVVFKQ